MGSFLTLNCMKYHKKAFNKKQSFLLRLSTFIKIQLDSLLLSESNQSKYCQMYIASQKHESTLLHSYVLNEFLTADRSCSTTNFFLEKMS